MKTCYIDQVHRGIADLVSPGELTPNWTITRINIPKQYRGCGYGTALLKQILDDADQEGATLQLEPSPSGPLAYDDLVLWYKRYGFRTNSYGYMVRTPT